jgi:hypothetical protein
MRICLCSEIHEVARISWTMKEFFQENPGPDDEPTACLKMVLLQICLEGSLCCNLQEDKFMSALHDWLLLEHHRLSPVLQGSFEENIWLNSRSYARFQLLGLDKTI